MTGAALAGRRVLVTGATGFIGSRLVSRLVAEGAAVHALVRPGSPGRRLEGLWSRIERHTGELRDMASLRDCVRRSRPELVFHLAKPQGAGFAQELEGALRLASVIHEGAPCLQRWVRTAIAAHEGFGPAADGQMIRLLAGRYGLSVVTLRLYQVYGPGQDPGHFPLDFIRAALAAGAALPPRERGEKDFVYVDDVVEAYRLAATIPGIEGETFEIGSGVLHSLSQAADMVRGLVGRPRAPARPDPAQARPGPGHPADLSKSSQRLGWRPRVSLERGLRLLIQSSTSAGDSPAKSGSRSTGRS